MCVRSFDNENENSCAVAQGIAGRRLRPYIIHTALIARSANYPAIGHAGLAGSFCGLES